MAACASRPDQSPGPKSSVIQRSSGLTGVVRAPSRTLAEPGASSGSGGASWASVKAISLGAAEAVGASLLLDVRAGA